MSKAGNWVPIDKGAVKTLGNLDRPYSTVEALFSYTVDVDCGRPFTYRGYAKMWQWSVGKVKRFIEGLMNTSGTVAERKGNGSGTVIHFIDKGLWSLDEQKRNSSGTVVEHKRVTTSNPNPNPNPKEEKKKRFTPPTLAEIESYCSERKNNVNPQRFLDHYTANNWFRGKTKIKDWKACVRTWEDGNGKDKRKSGGVGFTEAGKAGEKDWASGHLS